MPLRYRWANIFYCFTGILKKKKRWRCWSDFLMLNCVTYRYIAAECIKVPIFHILNCSISVDVCTVLYHAYRYIVHCNIYALKLKKDTYVYSLSSLCS
jgi:hypothetical protein